MHSAARKRILLIGVLAIVAPCAGSLTAGPPEVMRYQVRLTDAAGVPLSGAITATFAIYSVQSGGTALWSEVHALTPQAGSVDVLLGETIPLASAIVNASDLWFEVTVNSGGGPKVLGPRQRLASVPFSLVTDRLGSETLSEVEADVASSLRTHELNMSAHHVKTTSASELTSGLLDPNRFADNSIPAAKLVMGAGSGLDADTVGGLEPSQFLAPYVDGLLTEATLDSDGIVPWPWEGLWKSKEFSPLARGGVVSVSVSPSPTEIFWYTFINGQQVPGSVHLSFGDVQTETGIIVQPGDRIQIYTETDTYFPVQYIEWVKLLVGNPTSPQEQQ